MAHEVQLKQSRQELVEIGPFEDLPDCQCELDYEEQESEQSSEEVAVYIPPELTDERKNDIVVKRSPEGRLDSI